MRNVRKNVPSILLIIILVGFPQISESIFTPALPALADAFKVSAQDIQLTMSVYFIAFAIGVLFWGHLSDRIGRRKAMLLGIAIYFLGNISLILASHFYFLLGARFIQAFGASVGSVVTQTIMRESFSGMEGSKVFAKVGAAMALSPALGPLIGGVMQTYFGYHSVFSVLIMMAVLILLYSGLKLPETLVKEASEENTSLLLVGKRLITDKKVITYGLIIGGINGILFSYYAEAPFIFINHFHLSPAVYGILGVILAISSILGSLIVNYLIDKISAQRISEIGLYISLISSGLLLLSSIYNNFWLILVEIFFTFFGLNMTLPNALNLALIGYENVIGTASRVFSFGYYIIVSAFTYLISILHNGTIWILPIYIISITLVMLIFHKSFIKE